MKEITQAGNCKVIKDTKTFYKMHSVLDMKGKIGREALSFMSYAKKCKARKAVKYSEVTQQRK